MDKWEYCQVEVIIGGPVSGTHGELTIFKSDGKHELSDGRYGVLLAQLGDAGWEVVAASARTGTGIGGKDRVVYILKRPKAGDTK